MQGVLVTWLVLLTVRLEGLGGRPWLAIAILTGLCVLTSLPWFAARPMPDVMVPIFVLGVALLAFHAEGKLRSLWSSSQLQSQVTCQYLRWR